LDGPFAAFLPQLRVVRRAAAAEHEGRFAPEGASLLERRPLVSDTSLGAIASPRDRESRNAEDKPVEAGPRVCAARDSNPELPG
jgi:hypothetical protein